MQVIKDIAQHMEDELASTDAYVREALHYRFERPELAAAYKSMADTSLSRVDELHRHAVSVIRQVRESGVQYPAAMQRKWDAEHERLVDMEAKVRQLAASWTR